MDNSAATQMRTPPLTQDLAEAFAQAVRARLSLARFHVFLSGADLELSMLVVPKGCRSQGVGSEAVRHLCRFADLYGRRVVLSPASPGDAHGTTSRSRLVRFYKPFGFVENKGRQKDFAVSAGMFRNPQPARTPDNPEILQVADVTPGPSF